MEHAGGTTATRSTDAGEPGGRTAGTRDAAILVPEGTRLLHIGPPKTGTTSLQAALHASRASLLEQGVRYAGSAQHSRRIAYAALRAPEYSFLHQAPPARLWDGFVEEIRVSREPRVVISSEIFADGDDDAVRRVVTDLDAGRVHVVVTLRPLVRILASQWQQGLKGGLRTSYHEWLREIFDENGRLAARFWRRHRIDQLVDRWAATVGVDAMTAVVVDERDHGVVLRGFEGLLGLRDGTLPILSDRSNRSMTSREAETMRHFNVRFAEAGLTSVRAGRMRQRLVHGYLGRRRPSSDEAKVQTPAWALQLASDAAEGMVARVRASGIRVLGDLSSLTAAPATPAVPYASQDDRVPRGTLAGVSLAVQAIRVADAVAGVTRVVRGG